MRRNQCKAVNQTISRAVQSAWQHFERRVGAKRSRTRTANYPQSPWVDTRFDTVSVLLPLPFSLRIDMTELGIRIRGSIDGITYTLETTVAKIEAPNKARWSFVRSLPRRTKWRTLFPDRDERLGASLISLNRSDMVASVSTPAASDNDIATHCVLFSIRILNQYLRAYSIAAEDPAVRTLTPEAFDAAYAAIEFSSTDERIETHRRPYRLPEATRRREADVDDVLLLKRVQQGVNSTNNNHPMDEVILWRLRAEHQADYIGDYELAVVALQTSVERRVFSMRAVLLADQGADSVAVTESSTHAFKTAFNDLGATLHGGSWDVTDQGSPIGRYWTGLYQLRNSIAHDGATVSRQDAEAAFDAHRDLVDEIERRLLLRKTEFPRTAVFLFGAEGLRQKGMLSNRMLANIRAWNDAGEQWTFWLPYDQRQ